MAVIELDIVVKDQTLKSSISTVERLERQIIQANKAIIQGTQSQDRYNKILLSAKREYQALGMSSQKATSMVRQFAAANKAAQLSTSGSTVAINTQTVALQKNAIAGQQAKRSTNQLGVVTQQVGYQVGDFAVQVQGGQSAFVAFSQQATQLVGVLPLLSGSLGISAGKLIAISAGLGIAIPLLSALGGALFASYRASSDAGESIETFEDKLKSARDEVGKSTEALELLASGFDNIFIKTFSDQVKDAEKKVSDLEKAIVNLKTTGGKGAAMLAVSTAGNLGDAEENLLNAKAELAVYKELSDQSVERARNESVANQLSQVRQTLNEFERVARQEILSDMQTTNELRSVEVQFGKDSLEYLTRQQAEQTKILEKKITEEQLSEGLALALREALTTAQSFEQVDMGISIRNATLDTNSLIGRLSAAVRLAQIAANPILGRSDERGSQVAQTVSAGTFKAEQSLDAANKRRSDALKDSAKSAKDSAKASDKLADALEREAEALKKQADELNLSADATAKYKDEYTKLVVLKEKFNLSDDAFSKEVAKLNEELANSNPVLTGFVDAFSNFLSTGANDFKAFANDIINMFKGMLIKMITMAAKNKIMLSMGMGGSTLASSAAASAGGAASGGMMAGIGAAAGTAGAALVGGGMSAFGMSAAAGGSIATGMAAMPAMAAIGAVAAPLLAVAAVFTFFKKKTKELDSGLNVTVKGMDTLVESFSKVQTSRFFGLSKKTSTNTSSASSEVANPVMNAASEIQNQVVKAAAALGVGSQAFKGFTYNFKLSLKGLTEEQAMSKINEELVRMGNSFAALVPGVSSMAELTAIYQERLNLEIRLLQLQGNTQALRKIELNSVNDYNKSILKQIYATEDRIAADERAAQAAQVAAQKADELAQKVASILAQRVGLEDKLLQLQGNTNELRARELAGLDESNRALQEQIYAHENAAEAIKKLEDALNSLQENDFASMLDFQRARANTRMGLPVANNPTMPTSLAVGAAAPITNANSSTVSELRSMREDIKEMHKESMFAYSKLIKNGKDSRDTLRTWDVTGLPAERTA
tara:strand:- start:3097 stop:6261 length:3165 start_codon:yes stop_codon:yes gene_type:complete